MSLLLRSYVQPFRNKKLSLVYLSIFLGVFANSFLTLFVAIDTVRLGWMGMTAYLYGWLLTAGFVMFPLFYLMFTKLSRALFVGGVVGSQLLGVLIFLLTDISDVPWGIGATFSLFMTGYYQMCHANLSGHNSTGEVGFEISLAKAITKIGGLLGASLAGFIATVGDKSLLLGVAFLGVLVSTIGLSITLPAMRTHPDEEEGTASIIVAPFWKTFFKDLPMTLGTFMEAMWELFSSFLMPAYLILAGIGATMVGVLHGMQGLFVILAIPVAGKLIQEGRGREFQLAAILGGSALGLLWMPLNFVVLVASHIFRAMSGFFYHGGLEARWYGDKSFTQIFVRELNLTMARIVGIPVACWLCFERPETFLIVGFVVALLLWPIGQWAVRARDVSAGK